jgi:hypothetical protein
MTYDLCTDMRYLRTRGQQVHLQFGRLSLAVPAVSKFTYNSDVSPWLAYMTQCPRPSILTQRLRAIGLPALGVIGDIFGLV